MTMTKKSDLTPEPINDAIVRNNRTLRFEASNGRENGPYDLDGFAIKRGDQTVSPVNLHVDGTTMIAFYADPIQPGDEFPA